MFELSPDIDKNKIFLVNLSEIEGRLDPVMLLYQRKINNYSFNLVPIKNLLLSNPQYGANEAGIDRLNNKEPRYIRITDIDENGNLIDELGKTAKKIEQQYFLEHNDIIIARSGNTVGKSYIHKSKKVNYPCFFAGYMIRFKFNPEIIYPDYAFIVTQLNFYKEWLNAVRRLAGQPNINAEEYKNFKIPLPPKETQQKIIDLYETAYKEKQQKEAEAERLLNSIDNYLLGELDISLPEKDNSLENRMFKVNFSEVTGGRFDAEYYIPFYRKIKEVLNKTKYKLTNLSFIISNIESGSRPKGGVNSIAKGVFSIGGEHVDDFCNVGIGKPKYIPLDFHKKNIKTETKINDIILVKDGATTGKVGIITSKEMIKQNINEHVFLIRTKAIAEPFFLTYYLHSKIGQTILKKEITGATVTGLTKYIVKSLPILLPPLEKQNEIAEHIKNIREQAKQLKSEAKEVLEQAKQEVEQMILGEQAFNFVTY